MVRWQKQEVSIDESQWGTPCTDTQREWGREKLGHAVELLHAMQCNVSVTQKVQYSCTQFFISQLLIMQLAKTPFVCVKCEWNPKIYIYSCMIVGLFCWVIAICWTIFFIAVSQKSEQEEVWLVEPVVLPSDRGQCCAWCYPKNSEVFSFLI